MTRYRLAEDASDMRMVGKLLRKSRFANWKVERPVVMAFGDGKLVGFFATTIYDDMIIGGPLVLDQDRPRRMTALRLFELYEITLRGMGIERYITATELGSATNRATHAVGVEPYAVRDNIEYSIRRLSDGRRRHSSSAAADGGRESTPAKSG